MTSRQPHWEIVRSDAGWHARFRSSNGRVIVSSETYERRRDAVNAVAVVGDAPRYSDGKDADLIEVRDVDERRPRITPVIEWPVMYTRTDSGDYYHDRDTHWRHCYESDCVEVTPPEGAAVACRLGRAKVTAATLREAAKP